MVVSILENWCESKEQFYLLLIGIYHYFLYVMLLMSSVMGVS